MKQIAAVEIPLDQFEAMRWCDMEGLDQAEAGAEMGVSRGTIQRLLYQGRRRMMEAILTNSAITINLRRNEEDHVSVCTNE